MKFKPSLVLLISVFTLCFTHVKAQTAQNFSPSQLAAAERLFNASGVIENMQQMFATVIKNQSAVIPAEKRPAFIKVMSDFFAKYMNNEEIKKAFIPMYASEYSESELNQIADFLSSPAGKAMVAKQPELLNKGMEWGQKVAMDHKEELEAMMKQSLGN